MDHKNLEYFRKPQKLNRRQARWITKLQEYDFLLQHKPGNLLRRADALSRQPNTYKGEKDNEETILLKEELFQVNYQQIPLDLKEEIQQQ
jgi:hypothetical protein